MLEEICPGCGAPITPGDWMTTVPYNAAGARAHLGCLESEPGLQELIPLLRCDSDPLDRPVYLLARRTASVAWLQPHAAFVQLVGAYVLIQVPLREADAQQARLTHRGAGGESPYYYWIDAENAARGEAAPVPAIRGAMVYDLGGGVLLQQWGP